MPGTVEEMIGFVRDVLAGRIMPDSVPTWLDGSTATTAELNEITGLARYEMQRRRAQREQVNGAAPRRRARELLRTLLSAEQQRTWRNQGCFDVQVLSGHRYRFWPSRRRVAQLERHGKRWYEKEYYCLHPPDEYRLPDADETIAQLLLLCHSEEEFLAEANATRVIRDMLWNGQYLRRMRAAERERRRVSMSE